MNKPIKFLIFSSILLLTACSGHKDRNSQQIITATLQPNISYLYFSGTVQPLQVDSVISPSDGVVSKTFFNYGQYVKKGQLLMIINSAKLSQDYHNALTDFIKAKDAYNQSISSFNGTQSLYKAGIVDREDYTREQSMVATNELALIAARNALTNAAKKVPGANLNLEDLSLSNVDSIKSILLQQSYNLNIYSPERGIVLFLQNNSGGDGSDGSDSKAISAGSAVKEGQTIVGIGHMAGISTVISVDENHINKINPGQPVQVTCSALPNMVFNGQVASVAAEAKANNDGGGGAASFEVHIAVPTITDKQRDLLRIGMDAKVSIMLKGAPQIMVPIGAVFEKQGQSMVTIINAENHKQNIAVQTGQTNQDQVAILSGLKSGDKVVVDDQAQQNN